MGFFSKIFRPHKKLNQIPRKESQSFLNAKEYLNDKLANGDKMSAKDYFALDIVNGVAEQKFVNLLKKNLKHKNIFYSAIFPDVMWDSNCKYASITVTLKNFNHSRVKSGDDVSIMLIVDDDTEDDIEYEDFTQVNIYLENNDEISNISDIDDEDDEDYEDESEGDGADASLPLDKCPSYAENANFIYENATQKVKEYLYKMNIN